jgi:hypothetical protein
LPSRPGQRGLAHGPRAQWSYALGQLGLGAKSPAQPFIFQKNCCNSLSLAKTIEIYLCVGKMRMTYQNAQKNMLYILVSISCIVKQFEPCPK